MRTILEGCHSRDRDAPLVAERYLLQIGQSD
jgi:hypothetical protein